MNPTYDEEDCRRVAESRYAELHRVMLKTVSRETFHEINDGKIFKERKLSS